jgi:hypothetical protein
MGATLVIDRNYGNSMKEAYSNAVEDAIYENGNDSYNGTISTTSGFIDKTEEFNASGKSIQEYADYLWDNDKLNKWGNALGVCISKPVENTNKIKSQVKTNPQKGNRVWKTMYQAHTVDDIIIGESEYQMDAIKLARIYTEREKRNSYVRIYKKLIGSNNTIAEVSYKKSDKESRGVYYFIALAAE